MYYQSCLGDSCINFLVLGIAEVCITMWLGKIFNKTFLVWTASLQALTFQRLKIPFISISMFLFIFCRFPFFPLQHNCISSWAAQWHSYQISYILCAEKLGLRIIGQPGMWASFLVPRPPDSKNSENQDFWSHPSLLVRHRDCLPVLGIFVCMFVS